MRGAGCGVRGAGFRGPGVPGVYIDGVPGFMEKTGSRGL